MSYSTKDTLWDNVLHYQAAKGLTLVCEAFNLTNKWEHRFWIKKTQEETFQNLKNKLIDSSVFALFNPELSIEAKSAPSIVKIKAILVQKHFVGWRKVAYASRQWNIYEQNYTLFEKNCLAIMFALEKLKQYLEEL